MESWKPGYGARRKEHHEPCRHHANIPTSCGNGRSARSGRPVAHVARDLGIHKEALRNRVRQAEADAGERDDRLSTGEQDEPRQLRKEVAELRRANEILKAASVFFAQEIDVPGQGRAGDRPPA
ncbi:transposase [Embleya sp. MST-111070]|uniref:transposase n=1 Tax=Embleya sp. MST-111070 TaxID=3398231 RepID=UPI003F7417B4